MNTFDLYGVLNTSTGKLVSNITNPSHKYWEKKGSAESALSTYNYRFRIYGQGGKYKHNPDDLKVVRIQCTIDS